MIEFEAARLYNITELSLLFNFNGNLVNSITSEARLNELHDLVFSGDLVLIFFINLRRAYIALMLYEMIDTFPKTLDS